eukprot:12658472-Ditylum_brightwellii.AAC.1
MAWVYVNGRAVGMHKDSRLPVEFDITDYLVDCNNDNDGTDKNANENDTKEENSSEKPSKNRIVVVCVRYSDASFVEDQDHWWMAGLHRDVYLYCTQDMYIHDIFAMPHLLEEKDKNQAKQNDDKISAIAASTNVPQLPSSSDHSGTLSIRCEVGC